ncbi:MAG: NADP-dependent phosphogluconate dehydrogenase, partial [Pyrinomonadaceae bacterium]
RQLSAQKAARSVIALKFADTDSSLAADVTLDDLRDALLGAFIITYAQGLSLLQAASEEKSFGLDLAEIAKIWRGGCIIRSALLEDIRAAYATDGSLSNLLLNDDFAARLGQISTAWQKVIVAFTSTGVPSLCFSSALSYFEALRTERLSANLIQAQRDFFGAHTYKRIDKEGTFHTSDWDR